MNKLDTQVNKLFKNIPDSERKEEILLEIKQNLNEKVEDIISQGFSEEEAVKKTIEEFGDIGEISKELVGSARLEKSKNMGLSLAFSVWGGIILTAFFAFINLYYTPGNIWFVYPVFAVIWWPMSMYFRWMKNKRNQSMAFPFSVASFCLITALILFINYYYTPSVIWFVYPVFAVIWWPVALFFHMNRLKNRKGDDCEQEI